MVRPTHQNLRTIGDFATTLQWNVQVVKFPPAVITTLTSDDINLRADSTDMPRLSGQSTQIQIRGIMHKQPGLYLPSGQINMTLYEGTDSKITTFIRDWRNVIFDMETGASNDTAQVAATIRLVRLDRNYNEIYEYVLYNVFLEDYDPGGQLQSQGADALKASMTLSYDNFDEGPL
jgi:hypothetical protein